MRYRNIGPLGSVSSLTLGGGGIGQVWGKTTRQESIATVKSAVDSGITLLDVAPSYGNGEAEEVIGLAFEGKLPTGVRISTKCRTDNADPTEMDSKIEDSLDNSLKRLKLEWVDFLLLHNQIIPDNKVDTYNGTPFGVFMEVVVPIFEKLVEKGRIGNWGITGIGVPSEILKVFEVEAAPKVVQIITNVLDSPGALKRFDGPAIPRELINKANISNVSVMGIRAVQAGALTDKFDRVLHVDHPDMEDYNTAFKFRALASELNISPAALAHRYALSIEGVSTIVLGVKNREELTECIAAEEQGFLDADIIGLIDESVS